MAVRKTVSGISRMLVMGCLISACQVSAAPGDDMAEQSRKQLQSGDTQAALASAKKAIAISPNHYKSHYYHALSLLALEDFGGAARAAEKTLSLAPASARPAVTRLIESIKTRSPSPDAMLYLRCIGETSWDRRETKKFDATYRINLTVGEASVWSGKDWKLMYCKDPGPGNYKYIEYKDSAKCVFNGEMFYRSVTYDNVDDSGKKTDMLSNWEINRSTGKLETWEQLRRWNPATEAKPDRPIVRTAAACERTEEPKAASPAAVKF